MEWRYIIIIEMIPLLLQLCFIFDFWIIKEEQYLIPKIFSIVLFILYAPLLTINLKKLYGNNSLSILLYCYKVFLMAINQLFALYTSYESLLSVLLYLFECIFIIVSFIVIEYLLKEEKEDNKKKYTPINENCY